ncbi:STAS/SEC14 domain-containing protein [Vibrio sp. CDRSL-10 TSBA]
MFSVNRHGENRLDIQISGTLDKEGMTFALDQLLTQGEGMENGVMLYDVIDYHLPTLDAIWVELKQMPELIALMRSFNKAAILSDKQWIKTASELEGKLMPHIEIKAFDRSEKAQAEAWLNS